MIWVCSSACSGTSVGGGRKGVSCDGRWGQTQTSVPLLMSTFAVHFFLFLFFLSDFSAVGPHRTYPIALWSSRVWAVLYVQWGLCDTLLGLVLQPQFMYASGRTASLALFLLAAVGVDVSSTAWAGTDGTALLRHTITGRFEMLLLSRSWAGVVPCSNLVALLRHVARGSRLRRGGREFYPVVRIDTAGRKRAGS